MANSIRKIPARKRSAPGAAVRAVLERNRCVDAISEILDGKFIEEVVIICLGIAINAASQVGYPKARFMQLVSELSGEQLK